MPVKVVYGERRRACGASERGQRPCPATDRCRKNERPTTRGNYVGRGTKSRGRRRGNWMLYITPRSNSRPKCR